MNNCNKLDFSGQEIYIGMDVHKKSWSISIFTEQFEHKTWRVSKLDLRCSTFLYMVSDR
jgi:hypothetical protein